MAVIANFTTQFNLSASPASVLITDTTDYAGQGLNPALAQVNTYMESPAGVFHNNTSWVTPDMATGGLTFTHTLPLDPISGAVLPGVYNFEITINYNAGADSGNIAQSYTFCFEAPTPSIDLTATCVTSTLVSEDVTNYTVSCNGTSTAPYSITRTHTIKYPVDPITGLSVHADVVSSDAKVTITPIWTQTFTTLLSSDLLYYTTDGLWINYVVGGSDSIEVECDDTICCIYDCIWNLYNNYLKYTGADSYNAVKAAEYKKVLFQVLNLWMLYGIAVQCGETTEMQDRLNDIKDVVQAEACDCCGGNNDGVPTQVVPIFGGGGTGGTYVLNTSGNGISIVTTVIGGTTTWTVSIDGTTISIPWSSVTGTPTTLTGYGVSAASVMSHISSYFNSIAGGKAHVSWTYVDNKPSVERCLFRDVGLGTDAGSVAWKDLQSYTITASSMLAKPDRITTNAVITIAATATAKGYRLYWGSTPIIDISGFSPVAGAVIWATVTAYWNGAASQFVEWSISMNGVNTVRGFTTAAENTANPIIVKVSGRNETAPGLANDILLNQYTVEGHLTI